MDGQGQLQYIQPFFYLKGVDIIMNNFVAEYCLKKD